jgi:hypothetical protein
MNYILRHPRSNTLQVYIVDLGQGWVEDVVGWAGVSTLELGMRLVPGTVS